MAEFKFIHALSLLSWCLCSTPHCSAWHSSPSTVSLPALLSLCQSPPTTDYAVLGSQDFWWGLPWTDLRLLKLFCGLFQIRENYSPLCIQKGSQSSVTLALMYYKSLLFKISWSYVCPFQNVHVYPKSWGQFWIVITTVVPRFVSSLLYLGFIMSDFSDFTPRGEFFRSLCTIGSPNIQRLFQDYEETQNCFILLP